MSYDPNPLQTENQQLRSQVATLQRLEQENQQLLEQVKRLVRVERSMIEFQDKLDAQVSCYRQLNEIAQRLKTTFEPAEILQIAMEFMLYDLNFERCVVFAQDPEAAPAEFQAILWEGYDDDNLKGLTINAAHWQLEELLQGKDWVVCPTDAAFNHFAIPMGIDEFTLCGLRINAVKLQYLIVLGNTKARAKLFSRVTPEASYLVVLSNLLAQVSAAIAQANLYQSTLAQAATLRQTLEKLQSTQTQLIQTEKMSSLGQLVAGIAHEINNPVNFINGNITHAQTYAHDLLKLVEQYQQAYPNVSPQIQTALEAIDFDFLQQDFPQVIDSMQMGAKRIQEIVASLRNFSRMDESEYKRVDLHDGIESTLLILQHRLKTNHDRPMITLTKEYGDLPSIECAAGLINQVLMNLISNAIDATETAYQSGLIEQPTIKIRTTVVDDGVCVSIIDNGTGIPENVRHRLFDPFFTTKPVGKGTGLGLSISYQIITEKHQGNLECFSTIGQGTEFRIWLPNR